MILIRDIKTLQVQSRVLVIPGMKQKIKNLMFLPTAEEQKDGGICMCTCVDTHTNSHHHYPGDQSPAIAAASEQIYWQSQCSQLDI